MLCISVWSPSMASFALAMGVRSPVASTLPEIFSLSFSSRLWWEWILFQRKDEMGSDGKQLR